MTNGASGGHVWIVPSGFGKRVIPARGPYECALDGDGRLAVRVDDKRRLVAPDEAVDGGVMSAHEVADVITGPPFREWWLDARVYRLPLPVGWTMLGPADVPQCWFVSASLAVYVQTANRAPEGSEWEAAGQRVVARGDLGDRGRWVEVEYQHEGDVWRQRHVVMRGGTPRNVMITAQAPAGEIDEAVGLQQWLVERIVIAG